MKINKHYLCFSSLAIVLLAILFLPSCRRNPVADEGMELYNSEKFRYLINYPENMCELSVDAKERFHVLQIADKNNNYLIEILAMKTENDKRYKYDYYSTVDTLYYPKLGVCESETKDFWTDWIHRSYTINKYVKMETTSIYAGDIIYVIYAKFNEAGAEDAREIVGNFKTSSGRGATNFCERKIYTLIGDNTWSKVICYALFSIGLTILFWIGIFLCFQIDNAFIGLSTVCIYVVVFGLLVVTDELFGYIYGHNNLFELLGAFLLLFLDEG